MIALATVTSDPEPCVYLPDRLARTRSRLVAQMSAAEYEALLEDGWRKFGPVLYMPVCDSCRECRPLRIPVERFAPDRSQRRCLQRNADLDVRVGRPQIDAARLALFNAYHARQEALRGWPPNPKSADDYALSFLRNPVPALEVAAWEGDALRAVALVDVTPSIVSGVYHYHDPDGRERGLGVYVMLQVIETARRLERPWAHFGYHVADCPSLSYKTRFRPCELRGDDGVWRPFEENP